MICEACHGEGFVRGRDPKSPAALVMLPCLECNCSGVASCCDAAGAGDEDILKAMTALGRLRMIEAMYADERFDERACDHCGKPYRGPAVYCSLKCAQADA